MRAPQAPRAVVLRRSLWKHTVAQFNTTTAFILPISTPAPADSSSRGIQVADATWPEIERQLSQGARAVLPIGAAAKAHGRHLPLSTDYIQAEWLGKRLAERAPVVVWPALGYGHYPAFTDFPGSCSFSEPTFTRVVHEILIDIFHAGASKLLIINTGISTIAPLERVRRDASDPKRIGVAHIYRGPNFLNVAEQIAEQAHGGHADELETSIMLAIAPERVTLNQAERWDRHAPQSGALNRSDPKQPNYTPSGAWGDPTRATRAKGEALLAAILNDLKAALAGL